MVGGARGLRPVGNRTFGYGYGSSARCLGGFGPVCGLTNEGGRTCSGRPMWPEKRLVFFFFSIEFFLLFWLSPLELSGYLIYTVFGCQRGRENRSEIKYFSFRVLFGL